MFKRTKLEALKERPRDLLKAPQWKGLFTWHSTEISRKMLFPDFGQKAENI